MPFSQLRTTSASNLDLGRALTPLNIRPVERLPPKRAPPPPDPTLYRVRSLEDLAPETFGFLDGVRARKATENVVGDSSQMQIFLAAHASM